MPLKNQINNEFCRNKLFSKKIITSSSLNHNDYALKETNTTPLRYNEVRNSCKNYAATANENIFKSQNYLDKIKYFKTQIKNLLQKQKNSNKHFRKFGHSTSRKILCAYCNKSNHMALNCWTKKMHNKNKRIQRTNNPKTEYSKLACSTNNINMTRHTCDSKTNKNLVKEKCSPTEKVF